MNDKERNKQQYKIAPNTKCSENLVLDIKEQEYVDLNSEIQPFGYIYKIINQINGKIYIGKAESTIKKRWREHKWRSKHLNKVKHPLIIDMAIAKYGENNFTVEKLDESFRKQDLLRSEAYYIQLYNATNPEIGYNIDTMDWVEEFIYNGNDSESIWEIPVKSELREIKYKKWRESLIKKRIPSDKEEEFKEDLKILSGVQLEQKYDLKGNRRALLREIQRVLDDESIKTMKQAKITVGGEVHDPKKHIPQHLHNDFIEDFKILSGKEMVEKYEMIRETIVRNIKDIFKNRGSNILEGVHSFEKIKELLGGNLYSSPRKNIQPDEEREFKKDLSRGLTVKMFSKKYGLGTSSFYKELERITGKKDLKEIREHEPYKPKKKNYIQLERKNEFLNDLKILSGVELEKKYHISDRRILLREIRRILDDETLKNMVDVKKAIGGQIYNHTLLKKTIPKEREKEFKDDVKNGLILNELLKKYNMGTKAFYRELEIIFGTRSLKNARNTFIDKV